MRRAVQSRENKADCGASNDTENEEINYYGHSMKWCINPKITVIVKSLNCLGSKLR